MTHLFTPTPQATRILGLAGTGKTETLIGQLRALLDRGVNTSDIRVLCASPDACAAFKARLGEQAEGVEITTARDLALDILSSEEAIASIGRKPRILSSFEENFLLEDMKTGGLRPRRLREILKFFYRGWTELADEDEGWLITLEEKETHELIRKNLAFIRGILEPELSPLAFKYLRDNEQAREQLQVDHLFVDDYQCFNRASQALANILATQSITITGHEVECVEVEDPYPYAAGMEEFASVNPTAEEVVLETSHLPIAVTSAVNALLAQGAVESGEVPAPSKDAPAGSVSTLEFLTYHNEFDGIADRAVKGVKEGIKPSDIYIVSPNAHWTKKISSALGSRSLAVDALPGKQVLSGDIRDYSKCAPLRMYTLLRLAADPDDAVAWRSWCGYGDYLTNSATLSELRRYAETRGINLSHALKDLEKDPTIITDGAKILGAYRAAQALLNKVQDLTGSNLLETLGSVMGLKPDSSPYLLVRELCLPFRIDTADAGALAKNAEANLLSPRFDTTRNAVRIGPASRLCGLSPRLLIYSGFVNGFLPDRDFFDATITTLDKQEVIHARNTKALYTCIGKASGDLVFSYFIKTDLESAEKLKLEIERIRLEKGVRMCIISPSIFLETLQPS